MIRHWLAIAWRTVRNDPVFAAISILSLAIGCAGALLVGAYAREELTWDWWIPASERMVRLDSILTIPTLPPRPQPGAPSGLAPLLAEQVPGVESVTRAFQNNLPGVRIGDAVQDLYGYYVDPNFLQVIELPLAEGDPSSALADPSGIVLSQAAREMIFGREAALGRTITVGDKEAVVTGVLARLPRNTTLTAFTNLGFLAQLDGPLRNPQFFPNSDTVFDGANTSIYLRAESRAVARGWRETLAPLADSLLAQHSAPNPDGLTWAIDVIPFRQTRFAPSTAGFGDAGTEARLRLMILVAGALLFVSAFNYVSLSLARVVRRTREVGLRKAMGADRGHLSRQHVAESAAFTALALLLGFGLAELVRPWLVRAMNMDASTAGLHDPAFLAAALAGGALLALLVAAYPAAFLAGVAPATILQGRSGSTRALAAAIFALVAVQFTAATALVTSVAVFHAQAAYLQSAPLGYETEGRVFAAIGGINIGGGRVSPEQAQRNIGRLSALRAALDGAPGVISVSGTSVPPLLNLPERIVEQNSVLLAPLGQAPEEGSRAYPIWMDIEYPEAMGVKLLAGRLFDAGFGTDRAYQDNPGAIPAVTPVIFTRKALPLVDAQTPEEAVGRHARFVSSNGRSDVEIEIVGVIDDFYFRSLRYPASPVVFLPNPGAAGSFVAHVDPKQRDAAVEAIQKAIHEIDPAAPPYVMDLEQMAAGQYEEESRWRRLVTGAAVLAVGVACLGLYGLTAFSASQRRREVGVRKSLGADEGQVLRLMLARFARPVAAGVVLGWGVAWWAMAEWLAGFARHTALSLPPFLIAGAAAGVVAAATALWHALRAARTSPAIVLRTE